MPLLRRCVLTAGLAFAFAPQLRAQLPTPDQARLLLQTRPDLVAQLRAAIAQSGLTPDQIRARLRAAGYPDDLLDAYLPSGSSSSRSRTSVDDSLTTGLPSDDILDAMAALGLTDSSDTSGLRAQVRARASRLAGRRDSLVADSSGGTSAAVGGRIRVDSLGRLVTERGSSGTRPAAVAALDTGGTIFGLS